MIVKFNQPQSSGYFVPIRVPNVKEIYVDYGYETPEKEKKTALILEGGIGTVTVTDLLEPLVVKTLLDRLIPIPGNDEYIICADRFDPTGLEETAMNVMSYLQTLPSDILKSEAFYHFNQRDIEFLLKGSVAPLKKVSPGVLTQHWRLRLPTNTVSKYGFFKKIISNSFPDTPAKLRR